MTIMNEMLWADFLKVKRFDEGKSLMCFGRINICANGIGLVK